MPPLVLASAAAGLAFHAAVQPFELLDLLVVQMSAAFSATALALFYADVQLYHARPRDAFADVATIAASFFLSFTVSMLTYRAFFHRLHRFPGPFGAKLSKLWSVYHSAKGLKFHEELEALHAKYGDVVRTGPRELSIARQSAVAPMAACRKSLFYAQSDWKQERLGMLETRDLEDHRRRRRPWEMGLSLKEVAGYDADMQRIIGVFLDQIGTERGQRVNITNWTAWLAYDLMGKVAFGRDFGSLKRGRENPTVTSLRGAMKYLGIVFPVPWLINILAHIPGASGEMAPFFDYCKGLVKDKQKAIKAGESDAPKDVISWLIKAFNEGGPAGAPTQSALDEDTRALVLAGADTTFEALVGAFYYLAANPTVYTALQTSLDAVFPAGDPAFTQTLAAKHVPLLDAIINETLRLLPPVPNGQPRQTPPAGLRIDADLFVPGGVDVMVPQWLVQRDERYFERAEEFLPERWVAGSEVAHTVKDRAAWFPFQIGAFQCAGKQLAMWEMRSVLARVALRYDIRFASKDEAKEFEKGMLSTITLAPPPLRMCFRERTAAGKA